jgi:hypothetical protein
MRKRKLLKIFGFTILLDGMGSKVVYGSTVATTSAYAVSENTLIFCLTIFLGVIGWFIKTSFDTFRDQIKEQNTKIDACLIELTKTKEGLRAQSVLINGWHEDRKEIFDRVRHLESFCEFFKTGRGQGHINENKNG